MTDYLIAAYERYREDNSLLHPISKVDAEIIQQLILIFENQRNVAVTDILKDYKLEKDTDILALLKDYNKQVTKKITAPSTTPYSEEGAPNINYDRYLKVLGRTIDMWDLIGYDTYEMYSEDDIKFCLKLNPTPPEAKKIPFYANEVLMFGSKTARQIATDTIDAFFTDQRGKIVGSNSEATSKDQKDEESHDDDTDEVVE